MEHLHSVLNIATGQSRRSIAKLFSDKKVTAEQWSVLRALSKKQMRQVELQKVLNKDKGNVSRMLVRMVRNKWVSKEKDLSLTCEGRALLKDLNALVATKDTFASELTSEDRSTLVSLLEKLT